MKINTEDLVKDALKLDASYAASIDTLKIKFHEDYRKACEANVCGNYDTNWMGPPAIGPISELIKKVKHYKKGLLIETVHELADSFDWKGMVDCRDAHEKIFRNILNHMKVKYDLQDILPLSAGCCKICKRCGYLDGEKCRYPDKALSSLEAYGIEVLSLVKGAGLPYDHGSNKLSYIGLILFNE